MPEQVAEHWEQLEYAIAKSLPPTVGEETDKMNNILLALLDSRMDAWVSFSAKGDGTKVSGFMITQVLNDTASKTKSLLIYCLYGYDDVDKMEWIEGLKTLKKYKDSLGCRRVLAYTDIPYMIELAKEFGANTDYTFVFWE